MECPEQKSAVNPIRLCQTLIPTWQNLSERQISIAPLTGGLSNQLWRVHTRVTTPCNVIVRVYGKQSHRFVDRAREHMLLNYLNALGHGPRILATFKGGRIESFEAGEPLTVETLRSPKTSLAIAHALRSFHDAQIPLLSTVPDIWDTLDNWITQYQACLNQAKTPLPHHQSLPPIQKSNLKTLLAQLKSLKNHCQKTYAHHYLSHNDLVAGNILANRTPSGEVNCALIDIEYSSRGPRGFDIANLFRDWLGYGACTYPAPTQAQQQHFIQAYLCAPNTDLIRADAILELAQEIEAFLPVTDAYWGLWCSLQAYAQDAKTALKPEAVFDYGNYARYRLELSGLM